MEIMKKMILGFFTVLIFTLMLFVVSKAQTNDSSKAAQKQNDDASRQDKPVRIKNKPQASIGNCPQTSGVATLRATFDKSAKITDVEIVASSGCDSFDKKAVKAAKAIKFEPALKNGEIITLIKQLQYSFRKF